MSDDSVSDLLFLSGIEAIGFGDLVNLDFATVLLLGIGIQNGGYIDLLIAARVLIVRSEWPMKRHLDLGRGLVHMAVAHL